MLYCCCFYRPHAPPWEKARTEAALGGGKAGNQSLGKLFPERACLDLILPGHYQETQYVFPITHYVKRREPVSILCSRKQGKGTGPHPDSTDLGNPFSDYLEVGGPSWSSCPPADTSHRSTGPSMSIQRPASAFDFLLPTSIKGQQPPFGETGASTQRPFSVASSLVCVPA